MALWQFTTLLIPGAWARNHHRDPALLVSDEGFDTSVAWALHPTDSAPFIAAFDGFFPRNHSWHTKMSAWGDERATDIQLWQNERHVEEIQFRIHMGQNIQEIITCFITAVTPLDCAIFIPENNLLIEVDVSLMLQHAKASRAAAFCSNPQQHIRDIANHCTEDR